MLSILLLSVLIHFGHGEFTPVFESPNLSECKVMPLDWSAEYHFENRTISLQLTIPYLENIKDFKYFDLFVLMKNSKIRIARVSSVPSNNEYRFDFHHIENCISYKVVVTPHTNDISCTQPTYTKTLNTDDGNCTNILEDNDISMDYSTYWACFHTNIAVGHRYDYDTNKILVGFDLSDPNLRHCYKYFSLSLKSDDTEIRTDVVKASSMVWNVTIHWRYIFHDVEPCKVYVLRFLRYLNFEEYVTKPIRYAKDIDTFVNNTCIPKNKTAVCEKYKLLAQSQYNSSNRTLITHFFIADSEISNCFEKFYVFVEHEYKTTHFTQIHATDMNCNVKAFNNVQPNTIYNIIILPCYDSNLCVEKPFKMSISTTNNSLCNS